MKNYGDREVVFLLFLLYFYSLFRLVPAVVLTLETSEMSVILVFTTKTTQSRPQVFSANGALTCRITLTTNSEILQELSVKCY